MRSLMPTGNWSKVLVALIVWLLGTAGPLLAGESISADEARIVAVTVYTDRAEVTRQVRVDIPAGTSFVEFADIPMRTPSDSIRVNAEGVAATLGAVDLKNHVEEAVETPEFIAARDEVERIENELAKLHEADSVAQKLRQYLDKVANVTATKTAGELTEGGVDPAAIQAVYDLLGTNLKQLTSEALNRRQAIKDLDEDLRLARAKLTTIRPAGSIHSRVAVVEVSAGRAGALSMELIYNTPGASWRPAYRAALEPATGDVELTSEAVIRQATGEDWNGVALRLSTAAPARGVEPPEMTSWFLRPYSPTPRGQYQNKGEDAVTGNVSREKRSLALAPGVADADGGAPASVREAAVIHTAYAVSYEVAGKSDVPADNTDHRVVLRSETLPGTVTYRTVPALNPVVFLSAKTKAPEGYPLLMGPVRVFAGGAFLGSYRIEETAPTEELFLPFGIDNRIDVERVLLPQSRTREGFVGKHKQVQFAYRTVIRNNRDQVISLTLEDRVPVSEDERIIVEIGKDTTPGYEESKNRPGVLLWDLELAPKEELAVLLKYSVRHPKDINVPGI